MISILSGLSFFYFISILLLAGYGIWYYRKFSRTGRPLNRFPLVFGMIFLSGFFFLYRNMHAPLRPGGPSSLDHHFLRQEGFRVTQQIELGRADTSLPAGGADNRFTLNRESGTLRVVSSYSEEPLFASINGEWKLLSPHFPVNSGLGLMCDSLPLDIHSAGNRIELRLFNTVIASGEPGVRSGISAWNLFRPDTNFLPSPYYSDEKLVRCLQQLYLVREKSGGEKTEGLCWFVSGKLFRFARQVKAGDRNLQPGDLVFSAPLPDQSQVGWGIQARENNRNRYRVLYEKDNAFTLQNAFPVSYPLTEENNGEATEHTVTKFLVPGPQWLTGMPDFFREGFLFPVFPGDSSNDFAPVLLQYRKKREGTSLQAEIKPLAAGGPVITAENNRILLPSRSGGFDWIFSIRDSFTWKLGGGELSPRQWQAAIFGTLLLFFILVLGSWMVNPSRKFNWIWQMLTCISFILLVTRFFLYWRYKSFPPYEGLDNPSLQQLNSVFNFGIIIFTGLALAVLFGFDTLKYILESLRRQGNRLWPGRRGQYRTSIGLKEKITGLMGKIRPLKNLSFRLIYFSSWVLLLVFSAAWSAYRHFDPAVCRHLAIGLLLLYFGFVFISYRFSPLVTSDNRSWWNISVGRMSEVLINNPVKLLLSASLLGLYGFIDTGFAIIFLNFLLFNEAFLCINYAIAGLSAGSRRNASLFAVSGAVYLGLFILNLLYGPFIFGYLLSMPDLVFRAGYLFFSILMAYALTRLWKSVPGKRRLVMGGLAGILLFAGAVFFLPRERIMDKAAMTRYRIDVMTMPAGKAISKAYTEGKTWEPVIRAAQNQWFINAFIYEKNNPAVNAATFHLLPHAPQNKGARYNAQATDLVTSRFLLAEHGRLSVLFFALLLLLPSVLLAGFYKLYPDFTNRTNTSYPVITTAFSMLNYLMVSALLVILAATGRYIFFGQDLPFGSILSKQSVLFPAALIVSVVFLLRKLQPERYPHRQKIIPGSLVFASLVVLLFFVKPAYNKNRSFEVDGLAGNMEEFIETNLQPLLDDIDTARATRRLSLPQKDRLFTARIREALAAGGADPAGVFFVKELERYGRSGFTAHLDARRLLFLDYHTGRPQLAVNENYFHVEAPPHLQQYWKGNVYGDSSGLELTAWDPATGAVISCRDNDMTDPVFISGSDLQIIYRGDISVTGKNEWWLVNRSGKDWEIQRGPERNLIRKQDSIRLRGGERVHLENKAEGKEQYLVLRPDAFMKNLFVNGGRYYVYPMGNRFNWARNFAESVSGKMAGPGQSQKDLYLSLNREMTDSLSRMIQDMMGSDTSYREGAEYGICIADGEGRLLAMPDFIKGYDRPDPNDKAGFEKALRGENGYVAPSVLRKKTGNLNLLRLKPGPGSTLKPVVFAAIASQLPLDWNAFAAEGFSQKQEYFGGEKVAEYDFEKNNGRIASVSDYLKYSDNYYHANLLLLGSYDRQSLGDLLQQHFKKQNPGTGLHWPYFLYNGQPYWLDGFENWPGYAGGKANFGSDSSFLSRGLFSNFGIFTCDRGRECERLTLPRDSFLFGDAGAAYVRPEFPLFDQKGKGMDLHKPNEVFLSSYRGHVKGSSQVLIPPVKMLESFGKLVSQDRNYALTFNPRPFIPERRTFEVTNGVVYAQYMALLRESVFTGMREALFRGTAARLGSMLKNGAPWYFYAKTGTTGEEESSRKSKLLVLVISQKDISDPGFNFRDNKFVTVYFTSQNGPAKQNEEFQAKVIRYIIGSPVFQRYMKKDF